MDSFAMYKVMKKFSRGPEMLMSSFKTIIEAKKFIQEKLAEDASLRVTASYLLYEGFDLMGEFDQSKLETSSQGGSGSAGQQGSGQRFSPTPFNMKPQPNGMPHSWIKDEEGEKITTEN